MIMRTVMFGTILTTNEVLKRNIKFAILNIPEKSFVKLLDIPNTRNCEPETTGKVCIVIGKRTEIKTVRTFIFEIQALAPFHTSTRNAFTALATTNGEDFTTFFNFSRIKTHNSYLYRLTQH